MPKGKADYMTLDISIAEARWRLPSLGLKCIKRGALVSPAHINRFLIGYAKY